MGQTKTTQTNKGEAKTGTQKGTKNNMQSAKEQQKQSEVAQGTTKSTNPQEPSGNKRPSMHIGGVRKKMKVQITPPEYTIMDNDGEMIARMVQNCLAEYFDNVVHHRDRIQEEMENM
jgi:DNA-binding protein YbaB